MLKKSIKYLLIVTANLIALTTLLVFWTDRFELANNDLVRQLELLKILGLTVLSLIGIRILVFYFHKKNVQTVRVKLIAAALLTLLISAFLYIDYSKKFVKNVIEEREFRNKIADKIKPAKGLVFGTTAENLTIEEYRAIATTNRFPELPTEATNIMYNYQYDGFLPDYSFTLIYDLPTKMYFDTLKYEYGNFLQYRTFDIVNNKKKVTYRESKW